MLALTPRRDRHRKRRAGIETLKRRKRGIIRQVRCRRVLRKLGPTFKLRAVQRDRLWRFSRTTAWRYVKTAMAATGVTGPPAVPKGLRHGFGADALQASVPPHLVQRWLGHAPLRTIPIYGDVCGPDEQAFAARMWR